MQSTAAGPARWLKHPCFWMVVLGFLLRLVRLWYAGLPDGEFGHESGNIAAALAAGKGFSSPFGGDTGPTAWIGPVYPTVLALCFKVFGTFTNSSAAAILMLQCAVSTLTAIPMWCAGLRIVGRSAALVGVWTWALCPVFMEWPATFVWDMTFTAFSLTVLFLLTLQLVEEESLWKWLLWGALWGLAELTNPALSTCNLIAGLWLVARRRKLERPWLRQSVAAGLLCLVVLAPWLIRNRVQFGRWSFVRSNGYFELYLGNYATSNGFGYIGRSPGVNPRIFQEYKSLGEPAFIELKKEEFTNFVHEEPATFFRLTAGRMLWFWDGTSALYCFSDGAERKLLFWPWSVLAAFGLIHLWSMRREFASLLTPLLLLYPLPYYLAYPHIRYRHAIEPLMLLLIGHLMVQIVSAVRGRMRKREVS